MIALTLRSQELSFLRVRNFTSISVAWIKMSETSEFEVSSTLVELTLPACSLPAVTLFTMTDDSWRRVDVCATEPTKGGFAWSKPGWKDAHGSHGVAQSQRHALVPSPISHEGRRRNQEFAFDSWEGTVIASTTISPAIRLLFAVVSFFGCDKIFGISRTKLF